MSDNDVAALAVGAVWRNVRTGRRVRITHIGPNHLDSKPEETRLWHEGEHAPSRTGSSTERNFRARYELVSDPPPQPTLEEASA